MLIRLVMGEGQGVNKKGIYSGDSKHRELLNELGSCFVRQPLPYTEEWKCVDEGGVESKKDWDMIFSDNFLFSFNSLEQMKKWFCVDDLKVFEKNVVGFEYLVVYVDSYFYTKSQSMFNKSSVYRVKAFNKLEKLQKYLSLK